MTITSRHTEIQSYRDLIAWQKSFALGLAIYELSDSLPDNERFGLISQIRRNAVSISSNIAEGYGRGSLSDYVRFLRIARGAMYEPDTQLLFCIELSFIQASVYEGMKNRLDEAERVLAGLIRSLESKGEEHRPSSNRP